MARISDGWLFDTHPAIPITLVVTPPQSWVELATDPYKPEVLGAADLLNWAADQEGKESNSCPHYRQPQHIFFLGEYSKEELLELEQIMNQYEDDGSVRLSPPLLNELARWYSVRFPKCQDWRAKYPAINDDRIVDRTSVYGNRHLTPFELVAALVLCNEFGIRIEARYTAWRD